MTYIKQTWVDDDGSNTVGTPFTAARMNTIEQGIADAHSGVAGTMVKIGDLVDAAGGTSGAVAGQLGINNIPQTFSHLRLIVRGQSQRAGFPADNMGMRFNGISSNTYVWQYTERNEAGDSSGIGGPIGYAYIGGTTGGTRANDAYASSHQIDIPWYSLTDTIKFWNSVSGAAPSAAAYRAGVASGQYVGGTAAIVAISVLATLAVLGPRARATLYGII